MAATFEHKMAASSRPRQGAPGFLRFVFIFTVFSSLVGCGTCCTLPTDLDGVWVDSLKGELTFSNNTQLTGYSIGGFGEFTLTCFNSSGDTYIMESDGFWFFGMYWTGYFCWNLIKLSEDTYYFYEYSQQIAEANYEKVRMLLSFSTREWDDICKNTSPGAGTFRTLHRNQSSAANVTTTECPAEVQKFFTYNMTVGGAVSCPVDGSIDGCDSSTKLATTNDNCSTKLGYSDGGTLGCLSYVEDGSVTYLHVVNTDDNVDNSTSFRITCMAIDHSSLPYQTTMFPCQCPDDMNASYVSTPGAYVEWTKTSDCPTTTETASLLWIIGVVLGILLIIAIAMICGCLWWRDRKREKERQRQLDLQRATEKGEDIDGRYHGDDSPLTRSELPPNFTIEIIPESRSKGRNDLDGLGDEPGFRTTGDVTPSAIQPTYDAPHKRFSKRQRVWVIGDDGKAVKVWKKAKDANDGKSSPDSGVEDGGAGEDGLDGGKSRLGGVYSSAGQEKGAKDFLKQFGRKDVKAENELTEKGDTSRTSSKLMGKIKKMAGVRSFSRALKSRSEKRKKGEINSAYKEEDDRSSQDSYDSGRDRGGVVLGPGEKAKLKEISEKQKDGKGRDSPDSALSSRPSSSSSAGSSKARKAREGAGGSGGGDGRAGGAGDSGGRGGDSGGGITHPGSGGNNKEAWSDGARRGKGDARDTSATTATTATGDTVSMDTLTWRGSQSKISRGSRRKSDKSLFMSSLASTRDDVTLPSMSSGFLGSEVGENSPKATLNDSNIIAVTPRGEGQSSRGKGVNSRESTVSISNIELTNPLTSDTPVVPLERGRPPTGHQRRRGWQDGDDSRSRSDSRDRGRQIGRSQSERHDGGARSVRWQGEGDVNVPGTADAGGRRSVRWKEEGSSTADGTMVPVTPGMGIRRYPESDASTPSRDSRAYSSLSRLAQVHRKKRGLPLYEETLSELDERRRGLQRPDDMDDLAWKRLLEELYPDKKYLDYARASSRKKIEAEGHLHGKAEEGLSSLHLFARVLEQQPALVRPGTELSLRTVDSRDFSRAGAPSREASRAGPASRNETRAGPPTRNVPPRAGDS